MDVEQLHKSCWMHFAIAGGLTCKALLAPWPAAASSEDQSAFEVGGYGELSMFMPLIYRSFVYSRRFMEILFPLK